jgi:hypothetical protein
MVNRMPRSWNEVCAMRAMRWDIRLWLEEHEQAFELRNVRSITFDEDGCHVQVGDGVVNFDASPTEAFVVECIHEHEVVSDDG